MSATSAVSASLPRRPDVGALGNALVLVGLLALAVALAGWQVDPWAWAFPASTRWWAAAGVVAAYAGLVGAVAWSRRRHAFAVSSHATAFGPDDGADADWLVVHASQTGQAEALALKTAQALHAGGQRVVLLGIGDLDLLRLSRARRMLLVASTTGEGDAPDAAAAFVRPWRHGAMPALDRLDYGVLALGDRDYAGFCAFGHQLDRWLRNAGARPLFDLVEVDDGDAAALRHWQYHLGQQGGGDASDWSRPAYQAWQLRDRRHLNPGSPGGPVFELTLRGEPAAMDWQAGDIAEVGPHNPANEVRDWLIASALVGEVAVAVPGEAGMSSLAGLAARCRLPDPASVRGVSEAHVAASLQPLPHREYSIASVPAEGVLRLLVRQTRHPDGRLGSGSGWLTEHAPAGGRIDLRIRRNSAFHPPTDGRPLVMIGNGTGIAGLRALLQSRIHSGHRRNWLLFGERAAAHDFHFGHELRSWQRDGWIERLDLAFSRDQSERRYVQHLLIERTRELRRWRDAGAAIYVCGSLAGMAPAVDAALRAVMGDEAIESMAATGRYRRDVY